MTYQNIYQRGTQTTSLGVRIGRISLDSQHEGPDHHTAKTQNLIFTAILEATLYNQSIEK